MAAVVCHIHVKKSVSISTKRLQIIMQDTDKQRLIPFCFETLKNWYNNSFYLNLQPISLKRLNYAHISICVLFDAISHSK